MNLFRILTTTSLAAACALASGPALALPTHEREWAYYADAARTEVVGGRVMNCSGGVAVWGQQGPYQELIFEVQCEPDGPIWP